jgi:GNAT superfamily N-acetyltransferase
MRSVTFIRQAGAMDAERLAALINAAFQVEAFFKIGDRTSPAEILELIDDGEFLVLDDEGLTAGCVYLKYAGERAYFGMLSVDPGSQGQGLGHRLIEEAEARARANGCRFMDIHIVNLREELLPYYRRCGYFERGTLPFSDPERASRPCHFIVMTKTLA